MNNNVVMAERHDSFDQHRHLSASQPPLLDNPQTLSIDNGHAISFR
jgi:hypothetical protein